MAQTDTTEVKASSFDMGVAVNINTLIHQCIDDIQANDWESANTQINESARLFSTLENSSLFDDSKIEELKAEIWSGDGLPSIIKFNEEFSLANDLSEDIRAHISSRDKDLSAKLVRDSLIHSNSVSPLLKSDSVSYEILESNWNNTIQALWYQSYIK